MSVLKQVYIAADNIISALGFTSQDNVDAVQAYRTGIKLNSNNTLSDSPIQTALICADTLKNEVDKNNLTAFSKTEQLVILSVNKLLNQYKFDVKSPDFLLVLSTTKGNIDALQNTTNEQLNESAFLWSISERISAYYGLGNRVLLVSNACISGVSALIVAKRLLQSGVYHNVAVVGVDVLSHFISSGFASFKSLSNEPCRPYDALRNGLNLGEACGSMLLTTDYCADAVMLQGGAITNDANHISGPSRTGDGLYHAINGAMAEAGIDTGDVDYINLHGTATVYNDEMEAKAVHWAQLQHVPINSLKPYFGHTLGASGVIESIICAHQLKAGVVFGTLGYEQSGVSVPLNASNVHRAQAIKTCIKTASGFGGCNAAIVLSLNEYSVKVSESKIQTYPAKRCIVANSAIVLNSNTVFQSDTGDFAQFIREAYKALGESNMKFYKMDDLSKLGYIAAAYLLKDMPSFNPLEMGVILTNSAASLDTDVKHQRIIDADGDSAASPAVFVYTLANVVAGEICIRHKIQGENTFFIDREYSAEKLKNYVQLAMQNSKLKYCIYGWCNYLNGDYIADFELLSI